MEHKVRSELLHHVSDLDIRGYAAQRLNRFRRSGLAPDRLGIRSPNTDGYAIARYSRMNTGQTPHLLLRCRMPYTFEVDHALNRSTSVITGVINFDEAVAFIMERELFCALGYPLLVDVCSAELSLSGRDIVRLLPHLQRLVEIAPLAPTAVVVECKANLRVVQLVAAMATNLCCIRPFSTTTEAERWLGWNTSNSSSLESKPADQTVG